MNNQTPTILNPGPSQALSITPVGNSQKPPPPRSRLGLKQAGSLAARFRGPLGQRSLAVEGLGAWKGGWWRWGG